MKSAAKSIVPVHTVDACGFRHSLQTEFATIIKAKGLADAEFANRHRNDDVAVGCSRAKAGGELDGGAEEIVVVISDRLSGADSDADRGTAFRRPCCARAVVVAPEPQT